MSRKYSPGESPRSARRACSWRLMFGTYPVRNRPRDTLADAHDKEGVSMLHRFRLKTSILISFFALLVSIAYAQAPAGPNRPAAVPDGYVITPFGYFHP